MSITPYKDPILTKVEEKLISPLGFFKKVYHGDPVYLPQANLPACILEKEQTTITAETAHSTEQRLDLRIIAVINVLEHVTQSDDRFTRDTNELYRIVEGREETSYDLKEESILGLIVNNRQLDNQKDMRIGLGGPMANIRYQPLFDRRAPESWSIEATVEFPVDFIQSK